MPGRWVRPDELAKLALGRPVVLINGAFDLLHPGHIRLIAEARRRAKTLVAALDSDRKVGEAKGPGRPILTWIERATALGYLGIDYIIEVASQADMDEIIVSGKINFRVQGGDYEGRPTRYPAVPKFFVRQSIHTSDIVERIRKNV